MHNRLKLSHHRHTGRLRPHEYTSYLPLAVMVGIVGIVLVMSSVTVLAAPPPQAGSIGLSGTMPAPPPDTAATITTPTPGQHYSQSPITITGTCPAGTVVEIYKNDIFAGSAPCSDSGSFSFQIDLLFGQNILVARVYDALNQPGPNSNSVTAFYDALPPQGAALNLLGFGNQLILHTDAIYRGVFPEQQLNIPIDIIGGVPPYAVNIQWGDATNKIVPRNDNITFTVSHTYHKPGTFQILLQGSDSQGRVAFLTVAAIVNGQPSPAAGGSTTKPSVNQLLVLWPLYAIAATMLVSFWLGEQREKHLLDRPALTLHT